jgi:hypothetical protein
MDPHRLASVLDAGDELELGWEPPPRARARLRGLVGIASCALLFVGGFLLGTIFNPAHALRGPHHHGTSCGSTRGTCTDAP